ncbi:MAG: hypothetical protein QOH92_1983 [Chloroflexota bacterium]|jgi:hypothetical protein|nr:hypothetical protein [Chloroflexota bacterium]
MLDGKVSRPEAGLFVHLAGEYPESERFISDALQVGIPVKLIHHDGYAQPGYESPEYIGVGGGPGGLLIDLVIEHGSAVIDSLIVRGLAATLSQAFKKLGEQFYRAWFRIATRRYRRSGSDPEDVPYPIVTYEISLSMEAGGFDDKAFQVILEDYRRLIRDCEMLRKSANSGQWVIDQIEITRSAASFDEFMRKSVEPSQTPSKTRTKVRPKQVRRLRNKR